MFSSLEADNALDAVMESGSQSADPDSGSGTSTSVLERPEVDEDARLDDGGNADRFAPVSYTHLTLPTIYSV